jgi:hypothetical protein
MPLKFRDFKKRLKPHDVEITQLSGTHYKLVRYVNLKKEAYIIAVHNNEVDDCYVSKSLRRLKIDPELF